MLLNLRYQGFLSLRIRYSFENRPTNNIEKNTSIFYLEFNFQRTLIMKKAPQENLKSFLRNIF